MKLLFLTTILPSKKLHGSEIASQSFIDALNQSGCKVSVVGYSRKEDGVFEQTAQEILVKEQFIETKKAKLYPAFWFILSLIKNLPYSSAKYYSNDYISVVKSFLNDRNYDVIVVDHSQLGWLTKFIKDSDKLIFTTHNIEHEIYSQHLENTHNFIAKLIYKREADLIKEMEDKLANRANEVWTLTQHDANYFSNVKKTGKVRVLDLPSGFAKLQEKPLIKKIDIGIIGSWPWRANEEGLQWFLQKVYAHLPTHLSIHVAGRGAEWLTGKYSNIHYQGFVPDAQEFMAQAKVVAIPMLSGGGIQIKTLDAIASGSAIVATPVALRGISAPPQTVKVASQPEDFANLLVSAITSPSNPQAFDEAQDWYRARRDKFIADVASAINEL
jgi:hypothetical protein